MYPTDSLDKMMPDVVDRFLTPRGRRKQRTPMLARLPKLRSREREAIAIARQQLRAERG